MKEDKFLSDLLKQAALEPAPADFKRNVMQEIEALNVKSARESIQPATLFRVAFVCLCVAIVIGSFFIDVSQLKLETYVDLSFIKPGFVTSLLIMIPAFWLLILVSELLERKHPVAL